MLIRHACDTAAIRSLDGAIISALELITEAELRRLVAAIATPRHYIAEHANNLQMANWLAEQFDALGYRTHLQGAWDNLIAFPDLVAREPTSVIAIGAHFDSVPHTPGADDNASGIAAMLAIARALTIVRANAPVCFIAFNREEEGLIGSSDFVIKYLPKSTLRIEKIHVLEMIGYTNHRPGSQLNATGLPIKIPDTGDFLGILANRDSNRFADQLLKLSKSYLPALPVVALKVKLGLEKLLPLLARSDHAPFWQVRVPALLWTDTAEFRNPHYHLTTDTPDTLDYIFLRRVTQLLLADIISTLNAR
jgi:Zn-dependent M28 family amino/carboxypeptidase